MIKNQGKRESSRVLNLTLMEFVSRCCYPNTRLVIAIAKCLRDASSAAAEVDICPARERVASRLEPTCRILTGRSGWRIRLRRVFVRGAFPHKTCCTPEVFDRHEVVESQCLASHEIAE